MTKERLYLFDATLSGRRAQALGAEHSKLKNRRVCSGDMKDD
jgi:hypothetical protein